jgi:hypothetical protein
MTFLYRLCTSSKEGGYMVTTNCTPGPNFCTPPAGVTPILLGNEAAFKSYRSMAFHVANQSFKRYLEEIYPALQVAQAD